MEQYIPKSALVAELNRKKLPFKRDVEDGNYPTYLCAIMDFEDYINTLETKEVDLEKEIDLAMPSKYCWSGDGEAVYSKEQMRNFAKHFFELGMSVSNKTQKGEEV